MTRPSERGVALLLVIWLLALLSVIGVTMTAEVRSDLRVARNRLDAAQARALAEGGVWWAIDRLLEQAPAEPLRLDGSAYGVSVAGQAVSVAVQDEGGKLDLNRTPVERLGRLLQVLGFEAATAAALVGTLDAHRPSFAAIEELRLLPGIDAGRYARIAPFVTVHADDARVNPATAPREVLLCSTTTAPRQVDAYLQARAAGVRAGPSLADGDGFLSGGEAGVVTIRATARLGGATHVQEAVVVLDAQAPRRFRIAGWRRGMDVADAE